MNSNLTYPLYITAVNLDGRAMLGGIFKMHDEVGFPIDCCIEECKLRMFYIDWLECLADCWLNSCLKYDSFLRQIENQLPDLRLHESFAKVCMDLMNRFPKIKSHLNPIDICCRYILAKKKRHSWNLPEEG